MGVARGPKMTDEELVSIRLRNDSLHSIWLACKDEQSQEVIRTGTPAIQRLASFFDNQLPCRDVHDLLHEVQVMRSANALSANMIADWLDDQGMDEAAGMVRIAFPLAGDCKQEEATAEKGE